MAFGGNTGFTATPLLNGGAAPATIGQVVYFSALPSSIFNLAEANVAATANAIGVVLDASIAAGAIGNVVTEGIITLTTAQWDAIAGTSGGLMPNQAYYVSPTTAGHLTATPPSTPGQFITFVGFAETSTELNVAPQASIQVGSLQAKQGFILMAGQSNGVGFGDVSALGGSWALPYPNVKLYAQYAEAPAAWAFFSGALGPYATTAPDMGSELSLGRTIFANGCPNKTIAKFTLGNTDLATEWNPTGSYLGTPNLFQQMCNYALNLVATTGVPLDALVWIQGENDALSAPFSSAYGANLAAFMVAMRAQLGATLPIIIVQLNSNMNLNAGNIAAIQAAQAAYVASDPNSALVVTNDLTSVTGGMHYNAVDYVTLGNRIAAAVMPFINETPTTVTRDSMSLDYLPSSTTEWNTLLAGLPGSPVPPTVDYNFQTGATPGLDSMGVQNLTPGSGWQLAVPTQRSRYAMSSADNNPNAVSSTAGPFGDPYAASHLLYAKMIITAAPGSQRDVMGFGGGTAYRGVQLTSAMKLGLYDLQTATFTAGTATYAVGVAYDVFLQYDRTHTLAQIVTPLEVISAPFNLSTTTTKLFTLGQAVANAAALQIPKISGWRGASAEMSLAAMQAMSVRFGVGVGS